MGGACTVTPADAGRPTRPRIGQKILVLPNRDSNTIRVYNIDRCELERSIEIPLKGGVDCPGLTLAPHPHRPSIYMTGPDSEGKQQVYQLSLQGFNKALAERRVALPDQFLPCESVLACLGDDEYLYVFNVKGDCQRLDLTLNILEPIERPGHVSTLKHVLATNTSILMHVDDSLWALDQADLECTWVPLMEAHAPDGQYLTVGDHVFIVNLVCKEVKRYAAMRTTCDQVKDFPLDEMQQAISLVGVGSQSIYFTEIEIRPIESESVESNMDENENSDKTTSAEQVVLKEYNLSRQDIKEVGLLQNCAQNHRLVLCFA